MNVGEMTVIVSPVQWDVPRAIATGIEHVPDWQPLRLWFDKWFIERPKQRCPFLHCIHFLSDPEPVIGGALFELDLGTAPAEAMIGLIEAFRTCGVKNLEIGGAE